MFTGFSGILGMVFFAGKWYNIGKKIGRLSPPYSYSKKAGVAFSEWVFAILYKVYRENATPKL